MMKWWRKNIYLIAAKAEKNKITGTTINEIIKAKEKFNKESDPRIRLTSNKKINLVDSMYFSSLKNC